MKPTVDSWNEWNDSHTKHNVERGRQAKYKEKKFIVGNLEKWMFEKEFFEKDVAFDRECGTRSHETKFYDLLWILKSTSIEFSKMNEHNF